MCTVCMLLQPAQDKSQLLIKLLVSHTSMSLPSTGRKAHHWVLVDVVPEILNGWRFALLCLLYLLLYILQRILSHFISCCSDMTAQPDT